MKKTKLEEIKRYINNELSEKLPVTLRYLTYVEPEEQANFFRVIQVDAFSSTFHISTSHHKPISKLLDDDNTE